MEYEESYVKYLGMGLFFSLDSFYIQKSSNKINVYRNDNQVFEGNIEQIHIDNSYSCSVCYTVPKIELIKKINSNDLNVLKFETWLHSRNLVILILCVNIFLKKKGCLL